MERIKDGRRDIIIHGNATRESVPVTFFPDDVAIGDTEPFVPVNMESPTLYPGDVVVGVYDGEIRFAELIYAKADSGVMIDPLDSGRIETLRDEKFSRRFFQADEIHVYDDVVNTVPDRSDVEFDVSKVKRPETSRPR